MMKRGDIVKLKDGYRIYVGDQCGQYYFTSCHQTALNLSKELKENPNGTSKTVNSEDTINE